jgi:formylmethanofuran dehydrogenase subunit E
MQFFGSEKRLRRRLAVLYREARQSVIYAEMREGIDPDEEQFLQYDLSRYELAALPLYATCSECGELVEEGDTGFIIPKAVCHLECYSEES